MAGAGRRPTRKQEERVAESTARLLDATIDLLAEQGWAETTAAQIAERAGYSREMVRVRFGSKDGILSHLLGEWEQQVLRRPPAGVTGLHGILDRVDALEDLLVGQPRFARAILSYTFQSVGDPAQRTQLDRWISEIADSTRELLEAGRADGSISSRVEPSTTSRNLTDRALGLVFRWLVDPECATTSDLAAWRADLSDSLAPRS